MTAPTLVGFAPGVIRWRVDPNYPRWDRRRFNYTLQCGGCDATTEVDGREFSMLRSGFLFHAHDPNDGRRLCTKCRLELWEECELCRKVGASATSTPPHPSH